MKRFHSFFGILAASMLFLDPDQGGGSGGSEAPPILSLEDRLTKATSDLEAARLSVTSLTTERDTARTERDAARGEVTSLTGQFNSATEAATAAQGQVTSLTSQLATVNGELATAKASLTSAQTNVTRLESLCRVKGISSNQAVPVVEGEPTGELLTEKHFSERLASAKTPAERAKVTSEFQTAVAEGRIKQG